MTNVAYLTQSLTTFASKLMEDERSQAIDSTLSTAVTGMILYGYAFELGSTAFALGVDDAEQAVRETLENTIGCEQQLAFDIAQEAKCCFQDPKRHVGHYELIEVGMGYVGCDDQSAMIENLVQNVTKFKKLAGEK